MATSVEEKFPDRFLINAYHPTLFIYAFKRSVLDKLFEEVMQSNIAVLRGELWLAEGERYFGVIPLKNGDKAVLSWKIEMDKGEEWYDFVERSVKESLAKIAEADIEKKVRAAVRNRLYYHFEFQEES